MDKKKLIVCTLVLAGAVLGGLYFQKINTDKPETPLQEETEVTNATQYSHDISAEKPQNKSSESIKQITVAKDVVLNDNKTSVNGSVNEDLPFSAVAEISDLPENIQKTVIDVSKSADSVYMVKHMNNKVIMVVENQGNLRHGVEFVEISVPSGHRTTTTLGYNGKIKDSNNDIWEYDKVSDIQRPLRHTKYNSEGDVDFIEIWNYDDNPIKYEMKNSDGKVVSVRKETVDDGTNLRVEHIVYDKDGNTKVNVTASYEGADLKRFTYYNADKLSEGGSVFAEYKDGLKVKETLYTSDLKVKNVYEPVYEDGVTKEIKILDNKNNEIKKIVEK